MFGKNSPVAPKFFENQAKNTLLVNNVFFTLQGEGVFQGCPAVFVRLAKCNLKCNFCFPDYETNVVRTRKSKKRMSDVREGEEILALNQEGKPVFTTVKRVWKHNVPLSDLRKVSYYSTKDILDQHLICTHDHPFQVKKRGWVKASDLINGDLLYSVRGEYIYTSTGLDSNSFKSTFGYSVSNSAITSVTTLDRTSEKAVSANEDLTIPVYNFECEPYNTYCVNGVHVHNCDSFFDKGTEMTWDAIRKDITVKIRKFFKDTSLIPDNYETNLVLVITGGEPLLQPNLKPFIKYMNKYFSKVQIESNGLVPPNLPQETVLVVSPKAHPKTGKYFNLPQETLARADYLKLIIKAGDTVPDWVIDWERSHPGSVYLSPMNEYLREPKPNEAVSFYSRGLLNKKANRKNHEYTAILAMKLGFKMTLQAHLYANLR